MNHKEAIESGLFGIKEENWDKWPAICTFLKGIGIKASSSVHLKHNKDCNVFFFNSENVLDRASYRYIFNTGFTILSFEEFLLKDNFNKIFDTITLTSEYKAVIYKDKVIVGCQTISIEKIKEILKISEELS